MHVHVQLHYCTKQNRYRHSKIHTVGDLDMVATPDCV